MEEKTIGKCGDCSWFRSPSENNDEACSALISLPDFGRERPTCGLPTMLGKGGICETVWGTDNQRRFLEELKQMCIKHGAWFHLCGGSRERSHGSCSCQQSFDSGQYHPRAIDYCDEKGGHQFRAKIEGEECLKEKQS